MLSLYADAPDTYHSFVNTRSLSFMGKNPRERVDRSVGALLDLIVGLIGANIHAGKHGSHGGGFGAHGGAHGSHGSYGGAHGSHGGGLGAHGGGHGAHAGAPAPAAAHNSSFHRAQSRKENLNHAGTRPALLRHAHSQTHSHEHASPMHANVTEDQVARFLHARIEGQSLKTRGRSSRRISADSLVSALHRVEKHIMDALRHVPAFAKFSKAALKKIREAMSVGDYNCGEYVFEQGEKGDVFYLITTGNASVLRVDPDDPDEEEVCISMLGPSDCFGELALLRNEPRRAGVKAAGPGRLFVMYITKEEFEAAIGGPLSAFWDV
jgi:hypothetical protein